MKISKVEEVFYGVEVDIDLFLWHSHFVHFVFDQDANILHFVFSYEWL